MIMLKANAARRMTGRMKNGQFYIGFPDDVAVMQQNICLRQQQGLIDNGRQIQRRTAQGRRVKLMNIELRALIQPMLRIQHVVKMTMRQKQRANAAARNSLLYLLNLGARINDQGEPKWNAVMTSTECIRIA